MEIPQREELSPSITTRPPWPEAFGIQDLDHSHAFGGQPMMQVVIELADARD
jgi:hypothetical protein